VVYYCGDSMQNERCEKASKREKISETD